MNLSDTMRQQPLARLCSGGVLALFLAVVVGAIWNPSEGGTGISATDVGVAALVLLGFGLFLWAGLILLRGHLGKKDDSYPRTFVLRGIAIVWIGAMLLVYFGFRSEDGLEGPCSSTGNFVEEHFVPGATVRSETVTFPPGATRCIVETPNRTYEHVSPDAFEAGFSLVLVLLPFGLWPRTRRRRR